MDDVFGEIMGCGFGSDSIMLRLLRSAMDNAHENVQSKDGSIELLNARSKFYEMAMILVEGCSELIEEKSEISEINREKMLLDLKESRDMVRGRLKELKLSIVNKDIELMERMENEFRLRQAVESKEKELVSLRAKLDLERTKSEELLNYQASGDEGKEGDFRDLKNSVDQQMWSIKQKLEDERMSLSGGNIFFGEENFEEDPLKSFRPEENLVIEQMSSDIDCLKGTLDVAFGRMQNAEFGPLEKQWRWETERHTILILIKGFMRQLQEKIGVKLDGRRRNQMPIYFSSEKWSEFMNEIILLHRELKGFPNGNEAEEMVKGQESFEPRRSICRTSSEPLLELDYVKKIDEDRDEEGSNYVSKMIKNHESIIRKQHEQLNWVKVREIIREKDSSFGKRVKDFDNLDRRIKEIVARLENVINSDAKIGDRKGVWNKGKGPGKVLRKGKIDNIIEKLEQERDDFNLIIKLIEETYAVLFKGLINEFYKEIHNHEIEIPFKDDICKYLLRQVVNEWKLLFESKGLETMESINKERESHNFESLMREEIYSFIIVEAVKNATTVQTQSEARNRFSNEKLAFEGENLIHKLDCSSKCFEKQEDCDLGKVHQVNLKLGVVHERGLNFSQPRNKKIVQSNHFDSIFSPILRIEPIIVHFESIINQKLEVNCMRLEELAQQIHVFLLPLASSLRKGELVYRKAFERRCHNLMLAETEVDMLGDQVDHLLDLLEKIHLILDQNSPVVSRTFWVSDIINLIKQELGRTTDVNNTKLPIC